MFCDNSQLDFPLGHEEGPMGRGIQCLCRLDDHIHVFANLMELPQQQGNKSMDNMIKNILSISTQAPGSPKEEWLVPDRSLRMGFNVSYTQISEHNMGSHFC